MPLVFLLTIKRWTGDFNTSELLAMTAQLLVVLALLEFEHQLLGALELLDDLAVNLSWQPLQGQR